MTEQAGFSVFGHGKMKQIKIPMIRTAWGFYNPLLSHENSRKIKQGKTKILHFPMKLVEESVMGKYEL